jgi:outer membrane lipoprotein
MTRHTSLLALAGVALACARPPAALQGAYPPITVTDAQVQSAIGEAVRWGGRIVRVDPGEAETCFEIVGLPLDARARPVPSDDSHGRFHACSPGFFDPAIYAADREVTVVGSVRDLERGHVGERSYTFPKVSAEVIYLWPERRPVPAYSYGPWVWGGVYYSPYYYGYYGPWRPWGYYWPRHYYGHRHGYRHGHGGHGGHGKHGGYGGRGGGGKRH